MLDAEERRVDASRSATLELWLFVGLIGLHVFLAWPINMGPLQTGALMDGMKLSSTEAGVVGSVETVLFSLMLVGFPRLPCRIPTRTLGLVGLAGALIGNVLSSQADSFLQISLCRAFVGVSAGLIALAGFAALATAARVDRTLSGITVIVTLVGVATAVAAGQIAQMRSYSALFLFTASLAIACAVVAAGLPELRREAGPPLAFATVARSPLTFAALMLSIGGNAVWAFSERIGVETGLKVSEVGDILGVTLVAGLVAGVAAFLIARPGRASLLFAVGVVGLGAGCIMTALAATPVLFVAGIILMTFSFVFQGPFFTALTMDEDATGALTASITGWATLLAAAAPAFAGVLVEGGAFWRLGLLCAATTVASLAALVLGRRRAAAPK